MAPTTDMMCSWNCRGLGGPSTIPQIKEICRLHHPDFVFLCETKKKKKFISTVCRQLKCGDNWANVDAVGKSGGLLVFWASNICVVNVIKNQFCVEIEYECKDTKA